MKGVVAMGNHLLGIVIGVTSGLDAKVTEHGVRFPSSKQLHSVGIDSSTQESSGSTRLERLGGDLVRWDSRELLAGTG